jgi:Putative MetA-pathway of phenol degradation
VFAVGASAPACCPLSEDSARALYFPWRDVLRFTATTLIVCLTVSHPAVGQWMGRQTGCYAQSVSANPIAAHPNRPTAANPADITQYGVLEVEYGWDHLWPEAGIQQTSVGGLLKFGILCDVELRWDTTSFLSQTDSSGTHQSLGDNWLGPQIRFYRQTTRMPTLAFSYAVKMPSARTEAGLGTGRVDHAFTFLASKDIERFHVDFNVTEFLIGRPNESGMDGNQQVNLAVSHAIHGGLEFAGEAYGETRLNQTTPAFVSSLYALTYTVTPRLVIDGGFEVGLTSGGPHRHAFVGATYSIANLYREWRRR